MSRAWGGGGGLHEVGGLHEGLEVLRNWHSYTALCSSQATMSSYFSALFMVYSAGVAKRVRHDAVGNV